MTSTGTPARSRVSRTARAMATAAGLSPWTQIVCTSTGSRLPLTLITAFSCTMRSTRSLATSASWITEPGFLRLVSWPSSS